MASSSASKDPFEAVLGADAPVDPSRGMEEHPRQAHQGRLDPLFFGSRALRRAASGIEKAGAYDVYGMCLDRPFFIETTELFVHILEVV